MAKRKVRNPETLREHLSNLKVGELRKLARHVPENLPTRKDEIVGMIYRSMMTDDGLKSYWRRLDELQRAAVAEVVHSPSNRFDAGAFRAKYNKDPDWGTKQRWGEREPSILRLFFYGREMPTDLKAVLQPIVPKPRGVEMETVPTLPEQVPLTLRSWQTRQKKKPDVVDLTVRDTQLMAQQDLQAVLRLVEAGKVRVTAKTLRPTAATVRAITEILDGGDYYAPPDLDKDYWDETQPDSIRAFAWPMLLQSAKLAEIAGTKLQLTNTGNKALNAPLSKTLQTLWKRWLKRKLLDEFNRIKHIKGQTGRGQRSMTATAPRRQAIADAMMALPVNQWVEFNEFSRYMQAAGHTFEVSRDLWSLYLIDANYGTLGDESYDGWAVIQARYLLIFLMEYAASLGMIDIAYIPPARARFDFEHLWGSDEIDALSDYDGLRYLRLNNLGAWVLGLADSYEPPKIAEKKLFNVLPNHDIVIAGSLPAGDRLVLERFAKKTSDRVWQLDQNLLLNAHESGLPIAEIHNFLAAKSNTGLPETVDILLNEMIEKVGRLVKNEPAHLIEVRDSRTAHLLAIDSKLSKHCKPAGDNHLVVPAKSLSAFRRTLHSLGYALPQTEG